MKENKNIHLNIRRATVADLPAIGKLGSELSLQHVGYDRRRFTPTEPIVESHIEFFAAEIKKENTIFLVPELDEKIVGYAFIHFEPYSFLDLLAAGAWLHDVYLIEAARGCGVSKPFFEAIIKEARNLGSDSLMLSVSPHNTTARKFFEQFGFRPTMQEMRLDFEEN